MSLCTLCRQALPDFPFSASVENPETVYIARWLLNGPLSLHASWESFVTSLDADCPVCWTIWRSIRKSPISSPDDGIVAGFQDDIDHTTFTHKDSSYLAAIPVKGQELKLTRLLFRIWKTDQQSFERIEEEAPIPREQTSQSVADAANRWIRIYLGGDESTTLRLFESHQQRVPYIALSHRWTADTPTLLMKDYKQYCSPQLDGILPQSYRDIINDDDGRDFSQEAPLMMDIYRYAFLTIMIYWEFGETTVFASAGHEA
ncbi:hypothetical protein FBEOM_12278 [Fusarium beomiforme]|uniref:Uncharacterized protein n=1 Tax=Fusarium beomiforme TaxID=44412 RepID=A0A9P5DT66_9HYPO|nr:hypothetical protein FBEOM_12278 [Fusarium beomiforme]